MEWVLVLSALAMGLAGTPHCLAMCGAACTATAAACDRAQPQRALLALHAGRLVAYSAAGAVAAASVGALGAVAAATPVLRPLWTLVHLAALVLGAVLLWQGRQPGWLAEIGRGARSARLGARGGGGAVVMPAGKAPRAGRWRAAAAGTGWVALPCGLLHSALMLAALAQGAAGGAAVMAAFALASAAGLVGVPWLWWRLGDGGTHRLSPRATAAAVRLAGAGLVAASAFALGHGLWARLWALCVG
jgi:sulfite exporter TauE/SafE